MSHIDTLKVYQEYRASGLDDKTALEYTNIREASYKVVHTSLYEDLRQWFREAKEDFASQKLVSIMGGIIITMLLAMGGELWFVSKEVSILSRDMQEVRLSIKSK